MVDEVGLLCCLFFFFFFCYGQVGCLLLFFFSSRRRHTISYGDWSSDVCSSDLGSPASAPPLPRAEGRASGRDTGSPRPLGSVDRSRGSRSAVLAFATAQVAGLGPPGWRGSDAPKLADASGRSSCP